MKIGVFITIMVLASLSVYGQISSQEAIKKISFIEGKWEGNASVTTGPGQTMKLDQYENVGLKLGGKILSVEGKGYNKAKLEFNAFAIITFDEAKQEYEMLSWLATGQKTKAFVTVRDDKNWEWGFDVPQGKVRYFVTLNEKGQWSEKGEFSPNGTTWYPSFNMLLDKK